jgi:hypothetical protein
MDGVSINDYMNAAPAVVLDSHSGVDANKEN